MGEISHQVARFSEEMIVFGSSFDGARFGSVGAKRKAIRGEGMKQGAKEVTAESDVGGDEGQMGRPLAQGVAGSFEAEAVEISGVEEGGFEHESADEVVSDEVHVEFAANHIGAETPQHVQVQDRFDVPEEELHLPAAAIEFGEGVSGEALGIEQRGRQKEDTSSEARDGDTDSEHADGNGIGNRLGKLPGELGGLVPGQEPIGPAQAPSCAPVHAAALMEAKDPLQSTEPQSGEGGKGPEIAIAQQQIEVGGESLPQRH